MLVEMRIRDYAVIDDLALEFAPGLNALSGETGSGKSLVAKALTCLLGGRASPKVVRTGAPWAVIEATFDIEGNVAVRGILDELGLDSGDGFLALRRRVARAGRSRAWVNDSPATVGLIGRLGRRLADLHGQHQHRILLKPSEQRRLLDSFAHTTEAASAVSSLHRALTALKRERMEREARRAELEGRAGFMRFQLAEIEEAALAQDEDELLEVEAARLAHADELLRTASEVHHELYQADDAVTVRLRALQANLARVIGFDESLADIGELLEQAYQAASEAGRYVGEYASTLEHDPRRLDQVRARLDRIFRLKRKYGPELDDVIATETRLRARLDEMVSGAFDLEKLDREIEEKRARLEDKARVLSEARRESAAALGREMEALLPELGFEAGVFSVACHALEETGPGGAEQIEFLASLNPGFAVTPLRNDASGGELSRVMLALKSVVRAADRVPTLVFDEIEAGVGGEIANAVAVRLEIAAKAHQVLAITHLAQIASRAERHLMVRKRLSEETGLAHTRAWALDEDERVLEIARMLGGDPDSEASRTHARELLESGARDRD